MKQKHFFAFLFWFKSALHSLPHDSFSNEICTKCSLLSAQKLFLSNKQSKFGFGQCWEENDRTFHQSIRAVRIITESSVKDHPFILTRCKVKRLRRHEGRHSDWTASTSKTGKPKDHSRLLAGRLWIQRSLQGVAGCGGGSCGLRRLLLVLLLQAPVFLSSFLGVKKEGQWQDSICLPNPWIAVLGVHSPFMTVWGLLQHRPQRQGCSL